jgi:SAM-dependent methyltransferase
MSGEPGSRAAWREAGADPTKPSIARVYDYWLGGTHNLVADRELARRMETLDPRIPASCRASRAFLRRAVRFLAAEAGVSQFLDIGSGIPTAGNVHEIAQAARPGARVVYADRDPVAVAEGQALLADNPDAAVIKADLRDPAAILNDPETARLIDFSQPVGLILAAVLHFLTDAQRPYAIVEQLAAALAPGSFLVLSHATNEADPRLAASATRLYVAGAADGQSRSRPEIRRFFDGWELAEPGLVWAPQWRPDPGQDVPAHPERFWFLAGVARKPGPGDIARGCGDG